MQHGTSTRSVQKAAVLAIGIVLAAGCSVVPTSSGDLDVRTGCAVVVAERGMAGPHVVMRVDARGCRDPAGGQLRRDEAVERLERAVWQSLELPVDAIQVSVWDTEEESKSPATAFAAELADRFGPGPPGVVWPAPDHRPNESIWILLPVAYAAAAGAMLALVRRLRQAGAIVILFRR